MPTQADSKLLAERIRIATERASLARNRYAEKVVREVAEDLAQAEDLVKRSILRYSQVGSLPDNKLKARNGLQRLQADIAETMKILKWDQTLRFRRSVNGAFRNGIAGGIGELITARFPGYVGLNKNDTSSLARHAFTLVDRDALDFMANYAVTLAGDVQRELAEGIKRTLLTAITTGKGPADIVRDLGSVVKDPDAFRRAGGRVFQKAQYRMELIARTEVLRAHNQGRMKFHREVGVQKLEWLTGEDERTCSVCRPLHGRVFPIDRIPMIPIHPQCRCTAVVALPVDLLPPDQIKSRAVTKQRKAKLARDVFENGNRRDFEALSFGLLSDLAKDNGVSRSRTKTELLIELAKVVPGTNHEQLAGSVLSKALRDHGIGRARSKSDLIRELIKKQRELKKAREQVAAIRANPKSKLWDFSFSELERQAKKRGISSFLTRTELVELLKERDPKRDHTKLDSAQLIKRAREFGIGRHKTKSLLIRALEKQAGSQLAKELLN